MTVVYRAACAESHASIDVLTITSAPVTPSGTDRMVFAGWTGHGPAGVTGQTLKYGGSGGVDMTTIRALTANVDQYARVGRAASEPSTSAATIYEIHTEECPRVAVGAVAYDGVDTTTPAANITTNTGSYSTATSGSPTVTVTTVSGDVVVGVFSIKDDAGQSLTCTPAAGTTARYTVDGTELSTIGLVMVEKTATGASTVLGVDFSTSPASDGVWQFTGFVVNAAGGGGPPPDPMQYLESDIYV